MSRYLGGDWSPQIYWKSSGPSLGKGINPGFTSQRPFKKQSPPEAWHCWLQIPTKIMVFSKVDYLFSGRLGPPGLYFHSIPAFSKAAMENMSRRPPSLPTASYIAAAIHRYDIWATPQTHPIPDAQCVVYLPWGSPLNTTWKISCC